MKFFSELIAEVILKCFIYLSSSKTIPFDLKDMFLVIFVPMI
jgi:hypothetical protein